MTGISPDIAMAKQQLAGIANKPYRRRQHISVQIAENGFVIHQDDEGPYGEVYPRTYVFTDAHEAGRKLTEVLIEEAARQAE